MELWIVALVAAIAIGAIALFIRAHRVANRLHEQIVSRDTIIEQLQAREHMVEATPTAVLRHHHTFGPKDDDGIRLCRCGDRYTDGMDIRKR